MEISNSGYRPKDLFNAFTKNRSPRKPIHNNDLVQKDRIRIRELSTLIEDAEFSEIIVREPLTKIDIFV